MRKKKTDLELERDYLASLSRKPRAKKTTAAKKATAKPTRRANPTKRENRAILEKHILDAMNAIARAKHAKDTIALQARVSYFEGLVDAAFLIGELTSARRASFKALVKKELGV